MDDGDVDKEVYAFNFNDVDDTTFSDIVVVSVKIESVGGVCRGGPRFSELAREQIDLNENRISCPSAPRVGCKETPEKPKGFSPL